MMTPEDEIALEAANKESEELRDRFAMSALTGMLAADPNAEWTNKCVAERAYRIADAMFEARI